MRLEIHSSVGTCCGAFQSGLLCFVSHAVTVARCASVSVLGSGRDAAQSAQKTRPGSNFRTANCNENIPKFKAVGRESDVARPHHQNLDFPPSLPNGWNPNNFSSDILIESRLSSLLSLGPRETLEQETRPTLEDFTWSGGSCRPQKPGLSGSVCFGNILSAADAALKCLCSLKMRLFGFLSLLKPLDYESLFSF